MTNPKYWNKVAFHMALAADRNARFEHEDEVTYTFFPNVSEGGPRRSWIRWWTRKARQLRIQKTRLEHLTKDYPWTFKRAMKAASKVFAVLHGDTVV